MAMAVPVRHAVAGCFGPPPPINIPKHSTRVEWLEWWKGWPKQGGAFPLWSAWGYCGDMRRVGMRGR